MKISTKEIILVALFAALTTIGAFIKIPIPYVPFTLQFLFCGFAGILLGSKLGALTQLIYVLIGLSGVPVFVNGGGPAYILQPTFGYLLGFIAGAYVIGKIAEGIKNINFIKSFSAIVVGLLVIYLLGVPYLYLIYNFYLDNPQSVVWAVYWGFGVSIGGDLVLSLLMALVASKTLNILRKNGVIKAVDIQ